MATNFSLKSRGSQCVPAGKSKEYYSDFSSGLLASNLYRSAKGQVERHNNGWLQLTTPLRLAPVRLNRHFVSPYGLQCTVGMNTIKNRIWISAVARWKHSKLSRSGCQWAGPDRPRPSGQQPGHGLHPGVQNPITDCSHGVMGGVDGKP